MKKREDFAVSLRKKKTHDIIIAKRRKLMDDTTEIEEEKKEGVSNANEGTLVDNQINTHYKGFQNFEKDFESFNKILIELCPAAGLANTQKDQNSVNIVSFPPIITL